MRCDARQPTTAASLRARPSADPCSVGTRTCAAHAPWRRSAPHVPPRLRYTARPAPRLALTDGGSTSSPAPVCSVDLQLLPVRRPPPRPQAGCRRLPRREVSRAASRPRSHVSRVGLAQGSCGRRPSRRTPLGAPEVRRSPVEPRASSQPPRHPRPRGRLGVAGRRVQQPAGPRALSCGGLARASARDLLY